MRGDKLQKPLLSSLCVPLAAVFLAACDSAETSRTLNHPGALVSVQAIDRVLEATPGSLDGFRAPEINELDPTLHALTTGSGYLLKMKWTHGAAVLRGSSYPAATWYVYRYGGDGPEESRIGSKYDGVPGSEATEYNSEVLSAGQHYTFFLVAVLGDLETPPGAAVRVALRRVRVDLRGLF